MPRVIDDHAYYRNVIITRTTLFGWLEEGTVSHAQYRDCRGWELSPDVQVETLRAKTNHITAIRQNS
jgi:hypothetical protein